jgi:hypothetical protein
MDYEPGAHLRSLLFQCMPSYYRAHDRTVQNTRTYIRTTPTSRKRTVVLMLLRLFPLGLLVFWGVRVRFGTRFRGMVKQGFVGRNQSVLPRI